MRSAVFRLREMWLSIPLKTKMACSSALLIGGMVLLIFFTFAQTEIVMQGTYTQQNDYYNINSFMNTFIDTTAVLENLLRYPVDNELIARYHKNRRVMQQQLDRMQLDVVKVGVDRYLLANAMRSGFIPYVQACEELIRISADEQTLISKRYQQFDRIEMIAKYMELYTRQLLSNALSDGQMFLADSRVHTQRTQGIMLLVVILLSTFLMSVLYGVVLSIVAPMLKLSAAAREISSGNFEVQDVKVESRDEIYGLTRAFNQMKRSMKNIVTMLEERNKLEAQLYRHEIEALESRRLLEHAKMQQLRSQINPHFLFNTLNIISRTARKEKAVGSEKLILALARIFRYSLRTDDSEVPLQRELNIVNDYISIQTTRFENRVAMQWVISPEVDPDEQMIPSFLFQPLVENAIIHGLEPKISGGKIRIRIHRVGGALRIIISDNGVGMGREALDQLLDQQAVRGDVSGIGVGNVCSRLLLLHPGACFTIHSRKGRGTCVRLSIPDPAEISEKL